MLCILQFAEKFSLLFIQGQYTAVHQSEPTQHDIKQDILVTEFTTTVYRARATKHNKRDNSKISIQN